MTATNTKRAQLSEQARERIEQQGLRLDNELDYQGHRYFVTQALIEAFENYGADVAAGDITSEEAAFWVLRGEGYLGLDFPEDIDPGYIHPEACGLCGGKVLLTLSGTDCLDCGNHCAAFEVGEDYLDSE